MEGKEDGTILTHLSQLAEGWGLRASHEKLPAILRLKRIFYMLNSRPLRVLGPKEGHHVKPCLVLEQVVFLHEGERGADDMSLLGGVDRLCWIAHGVRLAGLHLDEHDGLVIDRH